MNMFAEGAERNKPLGVSAASAPGGATVGLITGGLLPLRIFRLTTLAGANAVGLLLGGSFFAFIFIGALDMQQEARLRRHQDGPRLARRLPHLDRLRRSFPGTGHPGVRRHRLAAIPVVPQLVRRDELARVAAGAAAEGEPARAAP
jgi:hypothetical protein